jgi:glutamate/tyrosine decarboxylase-like PLP-dependent enzyme
MLGTPLTCSILVTSQKNQLYESFSSDASYLYQTDEEEFNPGKISLQCGRRNDALKIWTIWKSRGHLGMEKLVDHLFDLAKTAYEYLTNHPDYQVYSHQPSLSVCFNYKNISAEKICTQLYESSELMVGYGSFRADVFIRLVLVNGNNNHQDILNFFQVLESQTYEN